jgi:phosphoenolpyruvate carboxykinase (ATP)
MSKALTLKPDLSYLNLNSDQSLYQLDVAQLVEEALKNAEGTLADNGALAVDTGKFTGRSPKDRFIVCDEITENTVWWGDINIKISPAHFDQLFDKITNHLNSKQIYVRDAYACADENYKTTIRVVTENAFQNLFTNNLFLRFPQEELPEQPEWTIIAAPSFLANPLTDGTRQSNFSILNFSKKMILIGGTAYTGEIKKRNFLGIELYITRTKEDTIYALFCQCWRRWRYCYLFRIIRNWKTTLSADPKRALIGDDEHGWGEKSVFNFEGGCYAKCIDLTAEKEPQIYNAIKFGSLLENTNYFPNTRTVDFSNIEKTENTRVAYPINYIDNAMLPSVAGQFQKTSFS